MSTQTAIIVIFAVVLFSVALALILVAARRRSLVYEASEALTRLEALNLTATASVAPRTPIAHSFTLNATSKQKYDRFDLANWMEMNVLDNEPWFVQEVDYRLAATHAFTTYNHDFEAIGGQYLGRSSHPRVNEVRFAAIEKKRFDRRKLKYPTPSARVSSTVKYRSPKGQNSYSRSLTWDFSQLKHGLESGQATRARQSTTQALRQRERSLMTSSLRMTILRRDSYRCRMCGASASNGATLHVDHIVPVSRDGRTVPENLQALCEPCNLGKSNRFIG
jgi:hypothetical protein